MQNLERQTYRVKGMHCASCSAIISKKIKKLTGVETCDVNFATEKATVAFDPQQVDVMQMNNQVNKLGYTLVPPDHTEMSGMDHSEHTGINQSKEEKLNEL